MAATRRLSELLSGARSRLRLVPGPVTVALSGGADSAALAVLALDEGVDCQALHINHGFPSSARLEESAREIAGMLGIEMESVAVEVGAGASPEERAREARYEVFDRWSEPLLTAHTREDHAETFLLNLIRGAGAGGLRGIPYHRPPVTYRPILDVTRSETREIAALSGLPFHDDPMNFDDRLMRNRLRSEVMPAMRSLNPQVVDSIARAAAALGSDVDLLEAQLGEVDVSEGVAVGLLFALPDALANRLLARMLDGAGVGMSHKRLERMWSVARGVTDRQELAGGRNVVRHGAVIRVE